MHLDSCEACSALLQDMQAETPAEDSAAQISYLKKIKKKHRMAIIITGVVTAVAVILLLFTRSSELSPMDLQYGIYVTDAGQVQFTGKVCGDYGRISSVKFSQEGSSVTIHAYAVPKLLLKNKDVLQTFSADGKVQTVLLGGQIIWEHGTLIEPKTAALFAAKNPYVGNMSANNQLAQIIGISSQFGSYHNELQTTTAPYGWTIVLEEPLMAECRDRLSPPYRQMMQDDSYILLALVENLDAVTWQYCDADGAQTYTVTARDASKALGQDIKSFGSSPSALQKLTAELN